MKLAACIALLCALYTGTSKAQDLSECLAAGRVAVVITTAVNQGTPMEGVRVGFPKAPPEMEEQNQAFVAKIKQVLSALLLKETMPEPYTQEARDFANHMGVEVAKQCAFDLGALRKTGSVQPPTADQLLERIAPDLAKQLGKDLAEMHDEIAASSQVIGDQEERVVRCNTALEDEDYIARLHAAGASFGNMRQRAMNSAAYLGHERLEKIMALIQEAQESGDVAAWHRQKRAACEGSKI